MLIINSNGMIRYEGYIGVHALRRYVLNLAWKSYQESIPKILKHFRAKKVQTERKIKEIDGQQQVLMYDCYLI